MVSESLKERRRECTEDIRYRKKGGEMHREHRKVCVCFQDAAGKRSPEDRVLSDSFDA